MCTSARARDDPHHHEAQEVVVEEPMDGPELLEMDYMYFNEIKVLTMVFVTRHDGAATVIDQKGPRPFAIEWAVQRLQRSRITEFRLRTDQEVSIEAVAKALQSRWSHASTYDSSPRYSHQSMGSV